MLVFIQMQCLTCLAADFQVHLQSLNFIVFCCKYEIVMICSAATVTSG